MMKNSSEEDSPVRSSEKSKKKSKKFWHNYKILVVGDSRVKELNNNPRFENVTVISQNGCRFRRARSIIRYQLEYKLLNVDLVIVIAGHCEITERVFDIGCLKMGCKDPVWYSVLKEEMSPRGVVNHMMYTKETIESRFPGVSLRFTTFPPVDLVKFNLSQEKKDPVHADHIEWATWDDINKKDNPRIRYARFISAVRDMQLKYMKEYFLDVWPAFTLNGDMSSLNNGKIPKPNRCLYKDFLHFSEKGYKALLKQLILTVEDFS